MVEEEKEVISPANAVLAFGAWLTCRKKVSSFGATANAAEMAELVALFNQHQGWVIQEDQINQVKPYPNDAEEETYMNRPPVVWWEEKNVK
jgi:hypothetical protein